jgi:hypothetical protein
MKFEKNRRQRTLYGFLLDLLGSLLISLLRYWIADMYVAFKYFSGSAFCDLVQVTNFEGLEASAL